jgi:hypothetical protein
LTAVHRRPTARRSNRPLIRAQHGNVNIYSIDPSGLGGMESVSLHAQPHDDHDDGRRRAQPRRRATTASSTTTSSTPIAQVDAAVESRGIGTTFRPWRRTAAATPIINTKQFRRGRDANLEENSAYYCLGYQSEPTENESADGDRPDETGRG